MRFNRFSAVVAAAFLGLTGAASAADLPATKAVPAVTSPEVWIVTVGVEGRAQPVFLGSDSYTVRPFPLFSFRRAGTPEEFRSPRDNIGFALVDIGPFKAGPVGRLRWERKESDASALYGLGNVNWAVELGGFVEYWWQPWLRSRGELRQGIGGHHGQIADLSTDLVVPVPTLPGLTLSGGPRLTLASGKAVDPYFGVDPLQSYVSGLPLYTAKSGVQSVGVGAQARYFWTPELATHVFVEYERLTGSVADSPLVTYRGSPDQVTVGFGITRAFAINRFW